MTIFGVDSIDLEKILDALQMNTRFHCRRDEMNAEIHLARDIRYSPITSETIAARDRLVRILNAREGK
jgi:hypothetical protein